MSKDLISLPISRRLGIPYRMNQDSDQARGLVGWYPALGNKEPARDHSASSWNMTAEQGSSLIAVPEMGMAWNFGSTNGDRHSFGHNARFSSLSKFTLAGWFRRADVVGTHILICKWGAGTSFAWALRIDAATFYLYVRAGGTTTGLQTTNSWSANTWVHAAATYDDPQMTVYLNGIQDNQGNHGAGGSTDATDTNDVEMGGRNWSTAYDPFNGDIAEARIYPDRAMTPAEIWELYDPATRWELYEPIAPVMAFPLTAAAPAGRTTRNTDTYGLGIGAGVSRTIKVGVGL